ncbi:universal stress protein [Microcella sp.]|uniref:universal stress protein n=1 Tax=Microcella sp. TaxID=1913979 RepID=UPI003F6FEE3C
MAERGTKRFFVVGVDGSDASVGALNWAIERAKLLDADVHVVTAWELPFTSILSPTLVDDDYAAFAQRTLDESMSKVTADTAGVGIETHLVQRKPALALTEVSRGADLLVIGAQGHGEVPGMHLGTVATYCVHHAPCPVLVHRTPAS